MKNKVKNCLIIMIGILLLGSLFPSKIYAAASASISASKTTINAGESTTISINVVNTETWEVKLSASGGTLSTSEGTDAFGEEKTTTALTSNFTANTAGTYTISFSGTVADSSLTNIIPVSGSVKINVKAAETPSTGNSGSGSTSNGGSGSNTAQALTLVQIQIRVETQARVQAQQIHVILQKPNHKQPKLNNQNQATTTYQA